MKKKTAYLNFLRDSTSMFKETKKTLATLVCCTLASRLKIKTESKVVVLLQKQPFHTKHNNQKKGKKKDVRAKRKEM